MTDSLMITQFLCTRLCHDLAGPIGAVAAGVELVGGDPAQVDAETLHLIASSSAAAARKLKFLRLALGSAGPAVSAPDMKNTVAGYLEAVAGSSGPAGLTWPADADWSILSRLPGGRAPPLLANLILMAIEVVPRVRHVTVTVSQDDTAIVVGAAAAGEISAQFDPRRELVALLAQPAQAPLTPKTVQALYTVQAAGQAGGAVAAEATAEGIRVFSILPKAG